MTPPPRTPHQRKQEALQRLEQDIDAWVATADLASGTPYLVPVSVLWDGRCLGRIVLRVTSSRSKGLVAMLAMRAPRATPICLKRPADQFAGGLYR
jgi:hypothetical protein